MKITRISACQAAPDAAGLGIAPRMEVLGDPVIAVRPVIAVG